MSSYRVVSTHQTGTTVELSVGHGSKIMKQTLFIENQPDDESFLDTIAAHTCELQIQKTIRDAQKKLQRAEEKASRKSKMASAKIISRHHVQEVQANITVTTIQQKYHTAAQLVHSGATFENLVQQYGFPPNHQLQEKQQSLQVQPQQKEEIQREYEGLN